MLFLFKNIRNNLMNINIEDNVLTLWHGDLAFKDNMIYCRRDHTINHNDMHDADFCIPKRLIKQIIVQKNPYVIQTYDHKYHVGTENIINVDSLDNNIFHITCTNLKCKIQDWFKYLKKNDIYVEIGVKFGAASAGVLEYSKENNLNLSINLFEKDPGCCDFIRQRFKKDNNVTVFEGNATEEMNKLDKKYDFVFFDAHHHYKDDYPILQALIPHLKKSTVILFDDYSYCDDVKKLVDEFRNEHDNDFPNVYAI